MPSHRVTDAPSIAPYLTHAVSHHGQVTLVPPDNSGRIRQVKPKKNRNQRQERNVRPEEDVRFNTGPRPLRTLIGNRGGRRLGRQDRGRDERHEGYCDDEVYPDYPPPSFLEAISTSSRPEFDCSATLSTVSPPNLSPITSTNCCSVPPLPTSTSSTLNQHQPLPEPSNSRTMVDDADSDTSSLEIIDMNSIHLEPEERLPRGTRLEEEVRRDWINRRGVEFPTPRENSRGRAKSRGRTILDSDTEDVPGESQIDLPQEHAKRRHLSLSPLRTFFPYRPMTVEDRDRAFSAHPSANASPYSSRSSLPFLSTTSLKMSLSTPSFASSFKGESFLSRKLLSFKGKERATSNELLDNWEVVEPDPSSSTSPLDPIEKPSSPLQSPARSKSHPSDTYGVVGHNPPHAINTAPPGDRTVDTSPHPLSLRDRKAPMVPVASRPRRRAPAPTAPAVDPATIPQGPALVSVRTRNPPPPSSPKPPQVISTSPLALDSWRESSIEVDSDSTTVLQRAVATPLPASPIDTHSVYSPPKPANLNAEGVSVLACPAVTTALPNFTSGMEVTGRVSDVFVSEFVAPNASGDQSSSQQTRRGEDYRSSDDHPPNARRHYPGRPLPQPPGTVQASTVLSDAERLNIESQTGSHCPEGLLIDLEDDAVVEPPAPTNPMTWLSETHHTPPPYTAASSHSSVDLFGSLADAPVLPQGVAERASPPIQMSSTAPFSQVTDLDVLASRIGDDEAQQEGSNYEALLLLSEFIGPATPTNRSTAGVAQSQFPPSRSPAPNAAPGDVALEANVPLLGNVHVDRRRTTKDGRVKLKLSLIDTPVDKCGICLTQFRSGDAAQLGSTCRHAFHERCLVKWLTRSKTCPLCRVALAEL
ncbi:hypothetical protein LshimejAT787_1102000 [Lyophyllum shimeji]|uniref:RING-type domain-containing protein n=1 Tax=Lyophyllum shimeji TaxID=47721 RepID=A0A9P3PUF4_LYOSH|nr:hypothetical protein LshimejAT787_1102000 [Lyophyllum shimeji]